jgi:hypothetical protein
MRTTAKMVRIFGNTFPIKDALKKLGGRWNSVDRCWMVPEAVQGEALLLVASAPKPERMESGRAVEMRRCWECGRAATRAEVRRNGGDWNEGVCGAGSCYCGC